MCVNNRTSHARKPSTARASGCTHTSFCREFTTSKDEICDLCHQPPLLGWLYHCSQDFGGFLPTAGGKTLLTRFKSDAQLYTLSDSIVSAAQNGHYTDEELSILWKQKSRVRDSVRQTRPFTPPSITSSTNSSRQSLTASSTFSTIESSDSDTDPDLDLSRISDQALGCRTVLEPIQEVNDETTDEEFESLHVLQAALYQPHTAVCYHKVCHNCRPSYRDRSFQSIDQVLRSSVPPPLHEWQNRRFSLANLLKDLDYTPRHEMSDTDSNCEFERTKSHPFIYVRGTPLRSLRQSSTCHDFATLAALVDVDTDAVDPLFPD